MLRHRFDYFGALVKYLIIGHVKKMLSFNSHFGPIGKRFLEEWDYITRPTHL